LETSIVMLNVPPCWSRLIVAEVDSIRTATLISESAQFADCDGDWPPLGGVDGGPDTVDGDVPADGGADGNEATVDGGWVEGPGVPPVRSAACDAPEPPHEFTMSRITTSNPATTSARRRQ